jgi:small subunit ribosomal protein S18
MAKAAPRRGKNKDNARRSKKKISVLKQEKVAYIDYKDVNLLRRFMSDRAKIRARRVSGNDAQQQTEVARAIKNAREMALLPYANRITTQRGGGRGRGRDGESVRADGPPPRPTAPPPAGGPDDVADADLGGGADVMVEAPPVADAAVAAPESVEAPPADGAES